MDRRFLWCRSEVFFAGHVEAVLGSQLGVADPGLLDYVTDLLYRFTRVDQLYRVRAVNGKCLTSVVEMTVEAHCRIGSAQREIHRHIGDYTLFWTGVYPEALPVLQRYENKDFTIHYPDYGRRAYLHASQFDTGDFPPIDVFERLSREYELLQSGLGRVRESWEND